MSKETDLSLMRKKLVEVRKSSLPKILKDELIEHWNTEIMYELLNRMTLEEIEDEMLCV